MSKPLKKYKKELKSLFNNVPKKKLDNRNQVKIQKNNR